MSTKTPLFMDRMLIWKGLSMKMRVFVDEVYELGEGVITSDLPYEGDYLILYTRFIFLVTAKTGREDFLFIPDSLGNHGYIS